ncbi:MAG: NAD-dependent deacylase [Candidatus Lokiarchaeota archaeon]|nr:NAD-dependent deacylase [Candidatus Lokiarchaeota archaeon]
MRLKGDAGRFSSEAGRIATLLRGARHAIALTGAGISTGSGIPDFRSPKTGLWNQKDAKRLTEPGAFDQAMEYFWKFGYEIGKKILKAKPNPGHKILAKWETELGIIKAIITQNVDELHQRAGSRNVIEMHGTAFEGKCVFCRGSYTMKQMMRLYNESGRKYPSCIVCSAPVRPQVVLFGEELPRDAMARAGEEIKECDVALLLGSSSVVYPANYLPVLVRENGGKVIIVNQEPTELDQIADVVVHGSISPVLQMVDALLAGKA